MSTCCYCFIEITNSPYYRIRYVEHEGEVRIKDFCSAEHAMRWTKNAVDKLIDGLGMMEKH